MNWIWCCRKYFVWNKIPRNNQPDSMRSIKRSIMIQAEWTIGPELGWRPHSCYGLRIYICHTILISNVHNSPWAGAAPAINSIVACKPNANDGVSIDWVSLTSLIFIINKTGRLPYHKCLQIATHPDRNEPLKSIHLMINRNNNPSSSKESQHGPTGD